MSIEIGPNFLKRRKKVHNEGSLAFFKHNACLIISPLQQLFIFTNEMTKTEQQSYGNQTFLTFNFQITPGYSFVVLPNQLIIKVRRFSPEGTKRNMSHSLQKL